VVVYVCMAPERSQNVYLQNFKSLALGASKTKNETFVAARRKSHLQCFPVVAIYIVSLYFYLVFVHVFREALCQWYIH
jgi:hypothetical protein